MATPKKLPSLEKLKELYEYKDGALYYKQARANKKPGDRAGTVSGGYRKICFERLVYPEHRLIWFMVTGIDPGTSDIDHIDRDKLNNRLENLRCVSHGVNQLNRDCKGWSLHGSRYRARIKLGGKFIVIGTYDTPDEAETAYKTAKEHYITCRL